jgi:hypothetical protein
MCDCYGELDEETTEKVELTVHAVSKKKKS